ncbi:MULTISPECIES: shikimate dehydrogenase [unclassified Rhodococcus (in: high G+C Gram-positive bacteria)]|uniref:shikimate dehydrogenase n=1 Tax=Rhodococcus sp. IEGM 1341 TaxID=3047090 RepID=UPI0011EC28A0|nr:MULTISPECIES: shikimate dehydrogenase [unclassified Rhodococcus (in: high G+C Gram-positive bacteria)]KAA0926772.1 shikimate dehydrogenase [Rhodococcus sp. ANT_H53B]MDI9924689.1 shikimate dehydrogenase [Rhodococcus sp. IEGM 1341]
MRAAVLGSPVEHSKSPVLHCAAYRALGLADWTYERIDCTGEQLPGLLDGFGPEWVGVSVTMPGKVAALAYATERTARAVLAGSANTLVRTESGWRADCTDVDGIVGALRDAGIEDLSGRTVTVVGAGGTSRPAIVALAGLGATAVTVVARSADRARDTLDCAVAAGMRAEFVDMTDPRLATVAAESAVLVSTVPATGAADIASDLAQAPLVLDAIYDPWPTPLATAVDAAGGTVISGLSMLLNQAYGQVEQFTGRPAPRGVMRDALFAAL